MKLGITGHQSFENVEWVKGTLNTELDRLQPERGFSSLAIGADQLFAKLLAQRAIPSTAIIPSAHYEDTFTQAVDRAAFDELLSAAAQQIQLHNSSPSEQAFFDAGTHVVNSSDAIIAVWNGKPAKGLGGTADMVAYATSLAKPVIHLNPDTKKVEYYGE